MLWFLLACAPYRSYPLLQFDAGQGRDGLELTGLIAVPLQLEP
ncbi:MAG TPA: hypothetical protein PKY30_21280 [Myxococcota bacterium]|nr:hypothetical protein [Myxococcota bacterium]